MRFKFLILPSVMLFQVAAAQNGSATMNMTPGTASTPSSAASSTPVVPPNQPAPAESAAPPASPTSSQVSYLDYKSVYDAATVEEEVKMATERFSLTQGQQDVWLTAAGDRRIAERVAKEKFEKNAANYEKEAVYKGLRSAHNTFHETIVGYLSPAQKQALETDRLILQEKQKRLAKLPPPPLTPTVTVAPVDSAAIKKEEKGKKKSKKSKKKG